MLSNLKIKNIVLIESLDVDFQAGFTALTGETGAGKSIILSALGLLLGKKADANILRFGADSGEVSGEFTLNASIKQLLEQNEIEASQLLIRRKITADGKSKAFVNDTAVSLKLLADIGQNLVEIHSQHEQSTLLDPNFQRDIIDKFAGLEDDVIALGKIYESWRQAAAALDDAKAKIEQAKRDEEYLTHVLDELSEFKPKVGEDESLALRRRTMMDFEKTAGIISSAVADLSKDKNVDAAIISAQKTLLRANNPLFKDVIECLERASIEISETLASLERISNNAEYNEHELENIEARLFAVRDLCRKYNCQPDDLPKFKEETAAKLALISKAEGNIKELTKKAAALENEFVKLAEEISALRKNAAQKLEKNLLAELKPLAMSGTKFEVRFTKIIPNSKGFDKLEFFASTNPGQPLRLMADVASGGEISRFMLALKVVLIGASSAPTVIFDEIDTGTGGAVAASIGQRLAKLGKNMQVFVVTHLPQVAACAAHHLKVTKTAQKNSTITSLQELDSAMRKEELARMLAGADITDEARAAAEALMAK